MSTNPSTQGDDVNLSALGRELLGTSGSKPSGPWVPPNAEELGKLLPDYDIVKMLGRGGMGAVYMGRQKSLDRPVAIKILSTALEDADPNFAERFKNEARAMGKLNHPGIVAVHDFGEAQGGLLYIVMEFVEGTDVAKMIAKEGRLHTEHAMAVTAHVCDALAYAHDRGIIHRDIKPANIMVGYDGVVKVADFGLAKMTQSQNSGLTQSGMAMGTLHYMAPEALMLGSAVDHRADIYAVGVMLYQMLTGKLPQGLFEMPSLQVPGLDPRYDGIIGKALREDREARYQSIREMREDLDGILTQPVVKVEENVPQAPAALPTMARPQRPGAGQPYRPPHSVVRSQPAAKSSSGGVAWAALIIVALVVFGGWWLTQHRGGDVPSPETPPGTAPATPTPALANTPPQVVTPTVKPPDRPVKVTATPVLPAVSTPTSPVAMPPTPAPQAMQTPVAPAGPTATPTLWIDAKGRTLTAKFLRMEGSQVVLDVLGKATPVELASLSEASQQIAQQLQTTLSVPQGSGFIDLFSPAEVGNWKQSGAGGIVIENGVGTTWAGPRNQGPWGVHWYTKRTFSDFVFRVEFRAVQPGFVSAMHLRFANPGDDARIVGQTGCQIRISDAPADAPVVSTEPGWRMEIPPASIKLPGEWNMVEVAVTGQSYVVSLNGQVVTRFTGDRLTEGYIGLQNLNFLGKEGVSMRKAVQKTTSIGPVQFRNVRIKDLKAPASNPVVPAAPASGASSASAGPMTTIPTTAAVATIATATKDKPFVNSLGMKFVPVPGTKVLFCIHETRRQDYEVYAGEKPGVDSEWKTPTCKHKALPTTGDHPVVMVNREDALKFCEWLVQKESLSYRLPTDREWSWAAGIGDKESEKGTPYSLSQENRTTRYWGEQWPPPKNNLGNYSDQTYREVFPNANSPGGGYTDGHAFTAPVLSFSPNKMGIHDLDGNVWELCQDFFDDPAGQKELARGSYWAAWYPGQLLVSHRETKGVNKRSPFGGFRVVLELP